MEDTEFEKRKKMADRLKEELNLSDRVYNAMLKVPRHLFVPYNYRDSAYLDTPLPIGKGQTISAPHMVAIMCELLDLREGHKVLEIGTGRGYHSAIVAEIVGKSGKVITIERVPELAEHAKQTLSSLGYDNVVVIVGDGSKGYEAEAPYDRIYATASAPKIPEPLIDQLKKGGKLVIPVGNYMQELIVVEKNDEIKTKVWGAVRFVPLFGEYGF
ncbi:protein-L-isoaspartate(D-aspartate) O-methyltransferase [Archaeoglobus sulfaticallidus PM70-1]|uniref:Protein-L-isoaspartate O-methyltransferase n=1 Tax=Archaeoglobus sulfaticallidus PM70-1 TaxID=387631 RepID=N0BDB0_9EURY|nr:protein-L-isoaspartate O-methyltransferase [Archaeoglobus sulfaticallidus]AGK61604.1 protein-L-isoaspartate(D-aspartate) O-methyltransferase [Archaeoglobus sulfaticallidus PM70-1]